ncbi:GGDEF domain-containing protein, partial [Vibrio alginolyticus]|uniref:GGDEF domain-containing protein n=1 Tax=Vibrio alginolyticus TaxID=663 RepID=UPI0022B4A734
IISHAVYLSVNCSGENYINRLHRNFLSLPYTRNQHSSVRTGGDEFVAILPGCSISQSSILAKKLRSVVKDNRLKTLDIEVSVSTGIAANELHETLQDVIVRADEDLYEMKKHRQKSH